MTSTPGSTPGTSDSAEPDDGDSPAPAPPATHPGDSAGADASATAAEPGIGSGVRGDQAASTKPPAETDPGTRWAEQQPPATSQKWAQPPVVPPQGGQRWAGPKAGEGQGSGPQQNSTPYGRPYNGQGAQPGAGWGRQGWQPPQTGQQWQAGRPPMWGSVQARPQAPKPGVIPLRPLDTGEILEGAVRSFRKHWRSMLGATLTVGVITAGLEALVRHQLTDSKALNDLQNDPRPSLSETMHVMGSSLASSGLMMLIAMIGTTLSSALLTIPISRAVLGRELRVKDMWHEARAHTPQVMGLALLIPLIAAALVGVGALPGLLIMAAGGKAAGEALAGLGVTAALVVFLWAYYRLCLSAPALVLEKQGVAAAMKRSWKLVHGSWWRVLGIQIMAMIPALLIGVLIQLPFLLIAQAMLGGSTPLFDLNAEAAWAAVIPTAVGSAISTAITLPLTAGVPVFLYLDQRIRRESLDIELARVAVSQS